MKKYSLIIFLFFCANSYGQNNDGLKSTNVGISLTSINGTVWLGQPPKQDTIRLLILVCDTTFISGDITSKIAVVNTKDLKQDFGVAKNRIPYVWWQFGYGVKKEIVTDEWVYYQNGSGEYLSYWITTGYLDQNKKPLPKSIIVWMTKEIK